MNKYRKIEITTCIFSDHSGIKLEIYSKKKNRKYTNLWRLNNILLNNELLNKKGILNSNEKENTKYKNLWGTTKVTLRKKITAACACIKNEILNK